MKQEDKYLIESLKRNHIYCVCVLWLICFFELGLGIRAVLLYNIRKPVTMIYLCAYFFLGMASLITALLLQFRKNQLYSNGTAIKALTLVYSTAIFTWSILVSGVDMYRGNYPIVFLTVMMTASALNVLPPVYCSILSLTGTVAIMVAGEVMQHEGSGFIINIAVFYIMSVMICFRNYRLTVRDYESTRKLHELSYMDQATGLRNRRSLDEDLRGLIQQRAEFQLIMGDIDCFKEINDTHGHFFGDECLQLIARELQAAFGNRVYRFGGDEFTVISDKDIVWIQEALDKFRKGIAYKDTVVHMSFGVSAFEGTGSEYTLQKSADKLLYQAKNAGKCQGANTCQNADLCRCSSKRQGSEE